MLGDLKLKPQVVYGDLEAPGKVLQDSRQEGVYKVEAWDPEQRGSSTVDPVLLAKEEIRFEKSEYFEMLHNI